MKAENIVGLVDWLVLDMVSNIYGLFMHKRKNNNNSEVVTPNGQRYSKWYTIQSTKFTKSMCKIKYENGNILEICSDALEMSHCTY